MGTSEDVMKALEAAFAAKKTSGRPAKKPKVEAKVVEEASEDEDDDDAADEDEDGDGLDDIFSKLKDKKKGGKKGKTANAKPTAAGKQGKGKQGAAAEGGGDDWFNSRGMKQSGRKYVDGLPVYSEDELRMNRGGGTTTLRSS